MPSIPQSTFASRLGTLSHRTFVQFVADLWAESGWETTVETPVVEARRAGQTKRLLVLPPSRLPRLRTAPDPGGPVDTVVSARRSTGALPRETPDVPVITADDLHERLCHAVPAESGDRLARDVLGVGLRGERWAEDGSLLALAGGDGDDGPITRRAALGALGAGAVGVGGVLVGRRVVDGGPENPETEELDGDGISTPDVSSGDDGGDDDSSDLADDGGGDDGSGLADDAAGDEEADGDGSVDGPEVSFRIEYDDEAVTITHDGGDPILARHLVVRGNGLRVGPAYRFTQERRYDVDDEVVEGDAITLSVDTDYQIVLAWTGGESETALARDSGPDPGESERPLRPDASFALELSGETLEITHDGGDGALAKHLLVRGGAFDGEPVRRWHEGTDYGPESTVEPGDTIAIDVDPDRVVVSVVWNAYDTHQYAPRPERLGHYRGRAEPLGAAGGVPTPRVDAAKTGYRPGVGAPSPPLSARWEFPTWNGPIAPPLVAEGIVYVASSKPSVHALDAEDGAELWRFEPDRRVQPDMTVADGTLFVPLHGAVHALDGTDGSERWTYSFGAPIATAPTVVTDDRGSVTDLYVTTLQGPELDSATTLHAVGPDGTAQWRVETDDSVAANSGVVSGGPAVAGEAVYLGTADGAVVARAREDGAELWRHEADERTYSSPVVRDGTLYAVAQDGYVSAFDRTDGSVRWQESFDLDLVASPAVTADRVIVGSNDGPLLALDRATGTVDWRADRQIPSIVPPVVVGDRAYVASSAVELWAIDTSDGSILWTLDREIPFPPAVTDRTLYTVVRIGFPGYTIQALESE